jgi:UDP-glucose 4-epimerase
MVNVGVTGATGFLGSYLCRHVPELAGYRLRGLTRTLPVDREAGPSCVTWMQGDLHQPADCADFVSGLDVVIHLAHTNTPLTSNKFLPGDALANLLPTLNLIEAIRQAGTRPRVIFVSSGGGVYSQLDVPRPLREDDACVPSTSYGIQKLAAELYFQLAAAHGWLSATALRISNPYGVLLPTQRRQGFIGVAVHRVLKGQPVRVFGDPENVRDYVHLQDVARAVALSIDRSDSFRAYNIGSGTGRSVRQILSTMQAILCRSIEVVHEAEPMGAELPRWNVLDITRANNELDWQPRVEFEDGLRALLLNSGL